MLSFRRILQVTNSHQSSAGLRQVFPTGIENMLLGFLSVRRAALAIGAILIATTVFAQTRTAYEIQYNSGTPGGPSPYVNQRAQVAAIVSGIGINGGAGGTQSFFVQDRDTTGYHGLFIRTAQAHTVAVGDSVFLTGTVSETSGQTQLSVYATDTIRTVMSSAWTPIPLNTNVTALASTTTAEPYEGMLVKVSNIRVTAVATDGITISDGTSSINVKGFGVGGRWNMVLAVGDSLKSIRANVRQTAATTYQLEPRSDSDFEAFGNNAPIIANIAISPFAPGPNDPVTFTATVTDVETSVSAVWLTYRLNASTAADSIPMNTSSGNSFTVIAGPFTPDSTQTSNIVRYKINARDSEGAISSSNERSFTVSLTNSDIYRRIIDYPDLYLNRSIQLEGQVVYIQGRTTSSGSWRTDAYIVDTTTSIGLYLSESTSPLNIPGMARGTYVRMTAAISQYNGALQATGASSWTVLDTLPLAHPIQLHTGDISLQRELVSTGNPLYYASGSWVEVTGRVISVDPNVGGGTNVLVDDGTGTIPLRIWDTMNMPKVLTAEGDSIPLTGMLGKVYTVRGVASTYNTDFQMLAGFIEDFVEQGASTALSYETTVEVPARVLVNDVGETMTIKFSAPPLARVQVRVFNMKGQVVATLIDKTSNGASETRWDGRDELREKLPLGTYILHVQSNLNGTTKSATAPIVIGTKL
ncbi:MAG: hypothetical protein OEM52_09385 [bacterium]|nr:hypothetical protein [bacterium]